MTNRFSGRRTMRPTQNNYRTSAQKVKSGLSSYFHCLVETQHSFVPFNQKKLADFAPLTRHQREESKISILGACSKRLTFERMHPSDTASQ
jgi:hypothetical protein